MAYRIKIVIEDPDKYPASAQTIDSYISPLGSLSDMAITFTVFKDILKDGNGKKSKKVPDVYP